jgi:hypothetical protein
MAKILRYKTLIVRTKLIETESKRNKFPIELKKIKRKMYKAQKAYQLAECIVKNRTIKY